MAGAFHVAGESGPDQRYDGAVAMGRVDAGPADLDQVVADRAELAEVELALRVEAPGDPRPVGRQHAVGGDDFAGGLLPDQKMVAVRVERIAVQAGFGPLQPGAQLTGEDQMAQPLGGADLLLVGGEGHPVARRGGGDGLRGNDGSGGEEVTGSAFMTVSGDGSARAAAGPSHWVRRPGPLLLP